MMPVSPVSTVIETFYPQGFAHDYHWTAHALGMRHFAVWNDTFVPFPTFGILALLIWCIHLQFPYSPQRARSVLPRRLPGYRDPRLSPDRRPDHRGPDSRQAPAASVKTAPLVPRCDCEKLRVVAMMTCSSLFGCCIPAFARSPSTPLASSSFYPSTGTPRQHILRPASSGQPRLLRLWVIPPFTILHVPASHIPPAIRLPRRLAMHPHPRSRSRP